MTNWADLKLKVELGEGVDMLNIVYVLPETQKSLIHPPNIIGFNALAEWFDFVEGETS